MSTEATPRNASARPAPQPRAVVCPYCGTISGAATRCERCGGRFDPLSRQATQNAMGPWFVNDEAVPTRPGCSYETIARMIESKRLTRSSVVRGPTTRQFWMLATRVPGVSHLLGVCHSCQSEVDPEQYACTRCGAVFEVDKDRQHLGVGPTRLLPGQGSPERIAAFSQASHAAVEMPSWSFAEGEGDAPSAPPTPHGFPAPPHVDREGGDRTRVRGLERRVASQQRLIGVLGGAGVVLAVLALVIAFVARYQGQRAAIRASGADAGAGLTRIEPIPPRPQEPGHSTAAAGAPAAANVAEPAPPSPDEGGENTWEAVRDRVHALIAEGTDEALTAAVLELEAMERRAELPAEGVELLARLRTEQEARRIRSIP